MNHRAEAVDVTHSPTETRFTILVSLRDDGPGAAYDTAVIGSPGVRVFPSGRARLAVVGHDVLRFHVAYPPGMPPLKRPLVRIEADPRLFVLSAFRTLTPQPAPAPTPLA